MQIRIILSITAGCIQLRKIGPPTPIHSSNFVLRDQWSVECRCQVCKMHDQFLKNFTRLIIEYYSGTVKLCIYESALGGAHDIS